MTNFINTAEKHFPAISAKLKATGVKPLVAYEAARAQAMGMAHDRALAGAFNLAYSEVTTEAARRKIETSKRKRA